MYIKKAFNRIAVLKSYFVVLTHNYVLENYVKYDKNKAVIIMKADYVFSEYELKKLNTSILVFNLNKKSYWREKP